MLERQEEAHVAAGGIQRSHHGHDEQRPEGAHRSERDAGGRHERASTQEQRAVLEAVRVQPDREREKSGSKQGGRREHADLQRIEAQQQEVNREQQAHEAVAEGAERAGGEDAACDRRGRGVHVRRVSCRLGRTPSWARGPPGSAAPEDAP
jgi:hypothetical protein